MSARIIGGPEHRRENRIEHQAGAAAFARARADGGLAGAVPPSTIA
jgi:hypothetical protein